MVSSNKNDDNSLNGTDHVLPGIDCASDPRYVLDTSNTCTNNDSNNIQHPVPAYIDFMTKAYGGTLLFLMVVTAHLNGASDEKLL